MYEEVKKVIQQYEDLTTKLSEPAIINDSPKFRKISIEQGALTPAYNKALEIEKLLTDIRDTQELLEIEEKLDLKEHHQRGISNNEDKVQILYQELQQLLAETDPNDERNAFVEIRAGAGGEEAALFAGELYRMYLRYAEKSNWKVEQLSSNTSDSGGFKEVIFRVSGSGVYGNLRYESGVHRVQRVPATESSGRIHTSAASVVVLPEVEDVEIELKDEDLKIDVFRSSGPGGQSVNTTDSAVRITHIPTDITVSIQDEKSQLKNRQKAIAVLKSRLYDIEMQKKREEDRDKRQSAIAGGDRSAKIRTYNFPQNRVTDHRIKKSWFDLSEILNGDLKEVISSTIKALKTS